MQIINKDISINLSRIKGLRLEKKGAKGEIPPKARVAQKTVHLPTHSSYQSKDFKKINKLFIFREIKN